MNSPLPAYGPEQRRSWTRRLVNLLVAVAVVAVAAATFVFSYDGVHAIALLGGVSNQLARYYPGLFDAVLVIACVAAVILRDGNWWARLWAWVVIVVLLAAIGTADVLHAMNYTLRHRATEGVVAAAPVVAVLLAFSLLLTLLRQSRAQTAEQDAGRAAGPPVVPALAAALAGPPIALPAAPATAVDQDWAVSDFDAPTADMRAAETRAAETRAAEPPAVPAAAAPARELPTREVPAAAGPESDEPAPPTVQIPALPPEPASAPEGEPTVAAPTRGRPIRYAGSGVPGMAGNSHPADRDASPGEDYWEGEEQGQFAGLVYPAREDQQDRPEDADDSGDDTADTGDTDSDEGTGEPAPRKTPPELGDDAPPFATAPFTSVPRLNRVRSMPTPPADEDE
jgi:hypothetical protein